jgi:ATPase family AAA domain-containing protein 3A/B
LDASPNAKDAFELAVKKEATKQLEITENTKKLEIQRTQIENEEKRKTIQYETEMGKRRAEYQVQLELQRDQERLRQKEAMRE